MLREATDSLAPVSFLGRCLVPTLHKESAKTKQLEKGSLLYGIYLHPIANTIWLGLYFYRSVQLVPVQGNVTSITLPRQLEHLPRGGDVGLSPVRLPH